MFRPKPLELHKAHDFCVSGRPRLTVVMIHGIASDASTYDMALKYLEGTTSMQDVRFVTFDLLGAGKSPTSDKLKYNYPEQIAALRNSIVKLKVDTPLVLVGHSMGTMIVTRYADEYRRGVKHLILVSPPIYSPKDFENPLFIKGMEQFKKAVRLKNRVGLDDRAFENEMKYIVMDPKNYARLVGINKPTTLIYGEMDRIIASSNIPGVLKSNPMVAALKTPGAHGVTHDKYGKILGVVEGILNETI